LKRWWIKENKHQVTTYNKKYADFYKTTAWQRLRAAKIAEHPECEHCWKNEKIVVPADCVDHIIPLEEDESLALDYDNLQSLCDHCHRVKTRKDVAERLKRIKLLNGKNLMEDLEN
jgi:5-methylcytosine-specific restriction protein A